MKSKLLLTTAALSISLGASGVAIAQDRSSDDAKHMQTIQQPDRTQSQNRLNEHQRSQTTGQAPSSSQTQNAPASTTQQQDPGKASGTGTSSSGTAQSNQPSSTQSPSSAQTTQPSANEPSSAQTNQPSTNRPSAAQTNQPSSSQPNSAQTTPSNQTQQPSTAQQQGVNGNQQAGNAQTNVRLSASLQTEQKTRLNQAVAKLSVRPVTNVNFSVAVGTTVPQTVTLHPVPNEIVTVIPQYRGYDFFMVRDEIVIVEPSSHRIVDVIERSGGARAQSTTSERKLNLSSQQREIIRKHSSSRRMTTGSAPRTRTKVIVGEEVPESVEIHSFPEEVYREVPEVRSYRYIEGDRGIYLVEPQGRRVIEDID